MKEGNLGELNKEEVAVSGVSSDCDKEVFFRFRKS